MSLKGRFRNLAAAFLMVLSTIAPMGGALTRSTYAAEGDPDLGVPEHSKTLTPNKNAEGNPDGTYTITLSVTGKAESSQENTKANVVVVFDTSGSMSTGTGVSKYEVSTFGQYGNVDNAYVELYYQESYYGYTWYEEVGSRDNHTEVYYRNSAGDYVEYSGERYNQVAQNRLDTAKGAVNSLAEKLLGYNTSTGVADMVEMAFIDFATNVKTGTTHTDKTASVDTFKSWVNATSANGGTNWEDALTYAKSVDFRDNDPVYVIFVSDGNPTFRVSKYNNNANDCAAFTGSGWNRQCADTLYGTGNSDPNGWNLAAAQAVASTITDDANNTLYAVGVFGDADNMRNLDSKAIYKDATDQAALNAAFDDIVSSITNSLSLTDIKYTDGITGMTTMSVHGTAGNFQYTLGGNATTDPKITTAKYENGEVIWDLGDYVLGDGVTATVSFTVWPSQESYDLVADLNNGKKPYSSLTEEDKKSVNCVLDSDGKVVSCNLKTNTDSPSLEYRTVKNSSDGSEPEYGKLQKVYLTNPDPVDLITQKLDIVKIWEDGLDPSQQADYNNEVVLDLYRKESDGWKPYEADIHITKEGEAYSPRWTADKKVAIAPGIMVSENSDTGKLVKDSYPVVDGYVILEEGHDYELREQGTTSHYYLTNYQYHPMLVDGEVKNVFFERDGNSITSVVVMDSISELSATNTLKGGIDVTKEVSGRADVSGEKFKISTIFEDENVEHTYRIIYGPNHPCTLNPTDDCKDENGASNRSKKITATGTVTLDYYVGDIIRFIDVDTGTKFKVEENADDLSLGYSLSGVEHKITHNAKDNYVDYTNSEIDGEWHIVQKNASSRAVVKNVYDATTLKITKNIEVLHGDAEKIEAETFDFKVTLKDGEEELAGEYSYTTNKGQSGKIKSGDTITLADDETVTIVDLPVRAGYEVEEVKANAPGYTTTVEGDESGILAKSGAEVTYKNTYDAAKVATEIKALKDFNDWYGDVFTFVLTDKDGNETEFEVSEKTDKAATFNIEYTQPGTYEYTITEKTTVKNGETTQSFAERGIVSSPNTLNVTVVVKDDGEGKLYIESKTVSGEGKITNTYKSVGTLKFDVSKILTGRDWQDSDSFTFKLFGKDVDGNETELSQATVSSTQTVTFDYQKEFTNDDVDGEFTYIIREVESDIAGITNGEDYVVTVTLTDDHQGGIHTSVENDTVSAEIENVYKTESTKVSIPFSKVITDSSNSGVDGEFTFELSGDNIETQTKRITTKNLIGSNVFNDIAFDQAGTYNYTIKEVVSDEDKVAGFTYDTTVYNVTVNVTDDYDTAKLSAEVTIKKNEEIVEEVEFTNIYDAESTKVQFEVEKALTGFEGDTPATFTFELSGDATGEATVTGAGTTSFETIEYKEAGNYSYTVKEKNDGASGYSYDDAEYTIEVEVVDEDAQLVPYVTIKEDDEEVDSILFENTYEASGDVALKITKAFDGDERDWEDEAFEFELAGTEIETVMTAVTDAESGWVASFDAINYSHEGEYEYTITEKDSGLAGVKAKNTVTVTVTVVDNGDGTLTATPVYSDNAMITNVYTTSSTTAKLHVEKKIDDQSESGVDGTFEFTLEGEDYADSVEVTTRGGQGSGNFEEIEFTEAGTYNYILKETKGNEEGYTYDEKEYPVVIVVEDNTEKAELEVKSITINGNETDGITITNNYKAEPVSTQFKVTKTLNGMNEGVEPVEFEFQLTGDGIEEAETVTIKGSGSAEFSEITYEKAGTYKYEIIEINGGAAGYIYDIAKFIIEVTVTDEGGKLVADVQIKKDGQSASSISFENNYEAEPIIDYSFYVNKILEGRELEEGEFSFTLYDEDGNVVATATNEAYGYATFTGLSFDKPGTYKFIVKEDIDEERGDIEFDENEYTITIVVADDGEGSLYIESDDSAEVTFKNKWNEPGHGEDVPNTGDEIVSYLALMAMSVIGLMGAVVFGKRKASEEE